MLFEHIMLDLETLSAGPRAVILSVGAVRFDVDLMILADKAEFYEVVDGEDCQRHGLEIDYSTVKWWMEQERGATAIFRLPAKPLAEVLFKFSEYVNRVPGSKIWGNGATFDNIILRNAYAATRLSYPVTYRDDLCYRTLRKLFPGEKAETGVAHNALDDARNQAVTLVNILRTLKGKAVIRK